MTVPRTVIATTDMNLSTRLLVLATLVAVHLPSSAGEISGVDDIEQALRSSRFVNFYFVSRTEKYDYDRQEMEAHAGVAIKRSCGWNCASFMGPVLTHLRDSMKVECPAGQQGVLITFGDEELMFSYSGKVAKFHGQCYFNEYSVSDIVTRDAFIFR